MRFVCIADTHSQHDKINIPYGDVLIHAGDSTFVGELGEIKNFNNFLGHLPHKHKIVIAGNHDMAFEMHPKEARRLLTNCVYLEDSEILIDGLRIYGTPWEPAFMEDGAFCLMRGKALSEKWKLIPKGIDILVTHCPPYGFCDQVPAVGHIGCDELTKAVLDIKPKYHIFGHVHAAYGIEQNDFTTFVNASICTGELGSRICDPIVFDL